METLLFLLEGAPKSASLVAASGLSQWTDTSTLHTGSHLSTVRYFSFLCVHTFNTLQSLSLMIYKLSVFCPLKKKTQTKKTQTAEMETKLIKKGMETVEKGTCVRFVPRTHQRDYIDIQPKSGWEPLLGKFDPIMFQKRFWVQSSVAAVFRNMSRILMDKKNLQLSLNIYLPPLRCCTKLTPWSCSNDVCSVCVSIQVLVLPWSARWKTDRVSPEPRLPPDWSGFPWIHARPGLCARAVPLWPGQLCHHHVAKHLEG